MSIAGDFMRRFGFSPVVTAPPHPQGPLPCGAKEPVSADGERLLWTTPAVLEEVPFSAIIPVPHKCPACRSRYAFRTTRARYCEHGGEGFRVPMAVVRRGDGPPIGGYLPPLYDGYLIRLEVEGAHA